MKERRWPKVCLKEEIRGIINGNLLRWGVEYRDAMRGVGDERTVEGIKRKKKQDTQRNWVGADKSTFFARFTHK